MKDKILVNRFQEFLNLERQLTRSDGFLVKKHPQIGYICTPKHNWEFLDNVELSELLTMNSPLSRNLVTVVDLEEKDSDKGNLSITHHALMDALNFGDLRDSCHPIRNLIDQAVVNTLVNIEKTIGRKTRKILHARLAINEPFLESSAYNIQKRSFMGLHYDKYKNYQPEDDNVYYLVGINFGPCERFFCFSRLSPKSVAEKRKIHGQEYCALDDSTSGVGSILRFYTNEPIYRITIDPLQAYIVPTQCIIHDGMTNEKNLTDICLFIACQFHDS